MNFNKNTSMKLVRFNKKTGFFLACKNGLLTSRYTYDKLNRMVREDNKEMGKTIVFAYDVGGNILSRSEYGFTLGSLAEKQPVCVMLYSYKANGWRDQMTAYNGEKCVYDAMGRPTTYRNKTLAWSRYGTLASYNGNTYTYDANGIRLSKTDTVKQVTTKFFISGTKILGMTIGTNKLLFRYGVNGIQGFSYNGQEYIYRKNIQGDITHIFKLTNGVLALAAEYKYDAWGKCVVTEVDNSGIGDINPIRYRGYYYDKETALYYLNARYYDPEVGRFISADSTQFLEPNTVNGLNLYAYCGNNPVMNVDPSGRFPLLILAILGIVVNTVIGAVAGGVNNVLAGGDFWAGFAGGAINGFLSSVGLAIGLALPGVGAPIAFGMGLVGGALGNYVTQGIDSGDWSNVNIGEIVFNGVSSGLLNLVSFAGISKFAKVGMVDISGEKFMTRFMKALSLPVSVDNVLASLLVFSPQILGQFMFHWYRYDLNHGRQS